MNKIKFFISLTVLFALSVACSQFLNLKGETLYFCEKYEFGKEIGKANKFSTGTLTVMVDLRKENKKIAVSSVDINITEAISGKVVDTLPYEVKPDYDYIHFDDINFKEPGKYKVSCIKKDGTVVASNLVEIVNK